jgi:hypothetical protein
VTDTTANPLAAEYHDMLRTVIDNTISGSKERDPVHLAAHATSSVYAWIAFRAVRILEEIAPERLPGLFDDLEGEMDSGEAIEQAWEQAAALGFDPQAWADDVLPRHARVRADYAKKTGASQ